MALIGSPSLSTKTTRSLAFIAFFFCCNSLPVALLNNRLNSVTQDMLANDVGKFFDEYSFEDPTSAHEIWMTLPSATKSFIARVHPEAADVMEQTDQQLLLVEQETERENLRKRLENGLREIENDSERQ